MLQRLTNLQPIYSYTLYNNILFITPIKLIIACVVFLFTLFDLIPKLSGLQINQKYISLGGLLSGFFGGLSGNQGALRTAFLVKLKLSKESFIATGVVIACFIDISRLCVYLKSGIIINHNLDYTLITIATLSAFIGTYAGSKLLKKFTVKTIQFITATLLLLFSVLLGSGII